MSALIWFRNDLRVIDNESVYNSTKNHNSVIAYYNFNPKKFEETKWGFKKTERFRAQFLIESSFITLIGIVIGIFLGIMQSYFIFREISKELEGATFSVPIGEVGFLIIITVIASILASVIPANEASKIYPAEALRYE